MRGLGRFAGVALLLTVVAACDKSPTGPSGQTGAIISGTVSSQVPPDLRVSAGSGNSVPVDPSGNFTLNGVPSGSAELRFTSAGTTASLPLGAVQPNETLTLTVSLNGGSVLLESLRRVHGLTEEVAGEIQSLEPSGMLVTGRSIAFGAATQFIAGGQPTTVAVLATGQRVRVKGQASGASLLASLVEIQSVIQQTTSLTGQISARTGNPPELVLIVQEQSVRVTASTVVRRKGETQLASTIATGQTVEVTGIVQSGGAIVATNLNIISDSPGGGFAMESTIQSQSGTCPHLQLLVSTYQVSAQVSTMFDPNCSDLAVGVRIEVVGIVQPDLSVIATSIRKK